MNEDEPIIRPGTVFICSFPAGAIITRNGMMAVVHEFRKNSRPVPEGLAAHIMGEFAPIAWPDESKA